MINESNYVWYKNDIENSIAKEWAKISEFNSTFKGKSYEEKADDLLEGYALDKFVDYVKDHFPGQLGNDVDLEYEWKTFHEDFPKEANELESKLVIDESDLTDDDIEMEMEENLDADLIAEDFYCNEESLRKFLDKFKLTTLQKEEVIDAFKSGEDAEFAEIDKGKYEDMRTEYITQKDKFVYYVLMYCDRCHDYIDIGLVYDTGSIKYLLSIDYDPEIK